MTTDQPAQGSPADHEIGESLVGSAWPEILSVVTPIATAAATVGKAYVEQRGETRRTEITQAAETEREHIRHSAPAADSDTRT